MPSLPAASFKCLCCRLQRSFRPAGCSLTKLDKDAISKGFAERQSRVGGVDAALEPLAPCRPFWLHTSYLGSVGSSTGTAGLSVGTYTEAVLLEAHSEVGTEKEPAYGHETSSLAASSPPAEMVN